MTIFPMRNGIRMITIKQNPSTLRSQCADAAMRLRMELNWSERALRIYSSQGIIDAAKPWGELC